MKKPATSKPATPKAAQPAPTAGQSYLVEIKAPTDEPLMGMTLRASNIATTEGFTIDPSFTPVPVKPSTTQRMAMLAASEDNRHVVAGHPHGRPAGSCQGQPRRHRSVDRRGD